MKDLSKVCILLLALMLMNVAINRYEANKLRDSLSDITTITIQKDIELRLSTATKSYGIDGEPFIKATFIGNNDIGVVKCDIPIKYEKSLMKDSIYKGKVYMTYIESLYDAKRESSGIYSDIIKLNNEHRLVSNLDFMFSEYVVASDYIKDSNNNKHIKQLKNDYISYAENVKIQSIASSMNNIIAAYLLALAFMYITYEIIGLRKQK